MILMNDFKAESPEIHDAMLDAVKRVLDSGWYVLGNEVVSFEKQWAGVCDAPYAIGCGNGMDAIEIGLRSLNIGPGDEVITTPMTAFATVLAILRTGATAVLADINPSTGLLCPESVRRCISSQTKAVLVVHLYGQIREMEQWEELCKESGIVLLEDCAQAHLAKWNGKVAGTFGLFGAYSFYPTKNLGAIGDGGALITSSHEIAKRASALRNYGQTVRYYHPELGMNSRLDEIQAALLSVRLQWLKQYTDRRCAIGSVYNGGIINPLIEKLAAPQQLDSHVYHLYVLKCKERDRLVSYLNDFGIASLIHYPVPIHRQEPCRDLVADPVGLSNAENFATECLSIPCHPQMSDDDVEKIIIKINI